MGSFTVTVTPQNNTTQIITYVYEPNANTSGGLSISITGLPSSLSAQVIVKGPTGSTLTMLTIVGGTTKLLLGIMGVNTYTLEPQEVANPNSARADREVWHPAQESYTVFVNPTSITNQTIPYHIVF